MSNAKGFTLIELVIVIVVLGILAAIAVPQFVDLRTDAQNAATAGVAGAAASASMINYAARSSNSTKGSAVAACADIGGLMAGGIPTGYTLSGAALTPAGAVGTCTVQGPNSTTTTFVGIGV